MIILLPIRMTSENPDMLHPIAIDDKELEILIIASIQTLEHGNKKCGNEEVFNLVKDSVDGVIKKEVLNNSLDILVQNQSVKNACPFLKRLYKLATNF